MTTEKAPEAPGGWSAQDLGRLLGVTDRRIRQIAAEANIRPIAHGRWPAGPIIRAAVALAGRERESDAEREARARLSEARACEVELRTAIKENELIPTEEAVAYTQAVVGALISEMNGLPARLTRDPRERRKIEAILDEIRSRIADKIADHGAQYRALPDMEADHG